MPNKILLPDLTYDQLKELLVSWGEPSFRADQLWAWLYRFLATDFKEMTNLSRDLREKLVKATVLQALKPLKEKVSSDGLTRKTLFALIDIQAGCGQLRCLRIADK